MNLKFKLLLAAAAFTAVASAQPRVDAVLNAAKYGIAGLPGYGVSQGSLATVFGAGFPAVNKQVSAFPLTNPWEGVTVKMTVGGQTVDGYALILQGATQMTILVPSNTPVGTGTITITVSGQSSAAAPLTVLASNFGIFTRNFSGQGPGVFLEPTNNNKDNNITNSAKRGETILDIWGTGLGPVSGSETGGPTPGNLTTALDVYIGGVKLAASDILYKGRSGCCAGIDQVRVRVPANAPTGCYVPVTTVVNNQTSNTVSMSVGVNGGTCSDVNGLSTALVNTVANGGTVRLGNVQLSRVGLKISVPGFGTVSNSTDLGTGTFFRYDYTKLAASTTGIGTSPIGSCTVFSEKGSATVPIDLTLPTPLDAGASLSLTGPKGAKTLTKDATGTYSATLGGGFDIPGLPSTGTNPPYLDPGTYTVKGTGGTDVGAFTATITVPSPLTWTNQDAISLVSRGNGVTVNWTGGGANDTVLITGLATIDTPATATAGFNCFAPASAGTFTVPSAVLLQLPATKAEGGYLSVASYVTPVAFTATGLDQGYFSSIVSAAKTVTFQ